MASHMTNASKHTAKRDRRGRGRRLWVVPVVIVAVLAAAYLGGVAVFTFLFLPGTTLDGQDVSLRQVSSVAAEKSSSLADFQTHVSGDGIDLTVRASDIDLTCDGETYARSAHDQVSPWAWPYEALRTRELTAEAGASFDRDKLVALVQPAVDESRKVAEELGGPGISFDEESGTFVLDERVVAGHLNMDALVERLTTALSERSDEVTLDSSLLDVGDGLTEALAKANSYVASPIELTLGGQHAYDVTAKRIAGWVKIADDLSVSLDTDAIGAWCHGDLSEAFDSVGTKRTYERPDGTTCTVYDDRSNYNSDPYGPSVYGWSIDGDKTAEQIASCLEGGQPATIDMPCFSTAATVNPGGQDWPDRYIDVDITAQHATFYDGGKVIWEADITTGQPSKHNDTPTGVWVVGANGGVMKSGDVNLRGPLDSQGNPEWDSHVNFWVPVVRNLVGFHNAPWQSTFGGDIYTYYGSNGCIRMSYESAEALYDTVKLGDVVVIHK